MALLTGFATAGAVPTVTLSYAVVQGLQAIIPDAEFAVNKFLGIPYADRPVRFAPAKKPLRRKHVINATAFPPACTQNFGIPGRA